MSLAQRMHFLKEVFQMTAIILVSVINHYHINGLHLFWDTQYLKIYHCEQIISLKIDIWMYSFLSIIICGLIKTSVLGIASNDRLVRLKF